MIVVFLLVAAAGVLILRRRKSRRLDERAGLVYEKPAFHVSPPIRSLIRREEYRW